ncbi:MAG: fibrobacter succinogenes major paralogous domain-containing protein [Fibromonadales bacterium]|nr:fibrobacter succinogenes major paralogous domain-containing protein [Fibromonadales bacterium]
MKMSNVTLLTAIFIATAFTSCSSDDGGGGNSSSSGSCDGRDYRAVQIGSQVWMAENLNCNVRGSNCYNNLESNCAKYGRLYNWSAAKSACPDGWHLPSDAEWESLITAVGGYSVAGRKLKAIEYWGFSGFDEDKGTDEYRFSALPGGYGDSGGSFHGAAPDNGPDYGYWWSNTEYNATEALYRVMENHSTGVFTGNKDKKTFYSVRCLQNGSSTVKVSSSSIASSSSIVKVSSSSVVSSSSTVKVSSSSVASSSSTIPSSSSLSLCAGFTEETTREHYEKNKAQFCDERDGQKYVYVIIGNQIWMAENLNYNASGSVCYDKLASNCTTYGRLYLYAKTVCPSGWHLPSDAEWDAFMTAVGGTSTAGKKLKAKSGWNSNGNGTDDYGFSALPGGYGKSDGSFDSVGNIGLWWSASEYNNDVVAYSHRMRYSIDGIELNSSPRTTSLFSVRCVKN